MLIIAWTGERYPPLHEPNVFAQYRCEQGHYFETLSIFDGTFYQEHYIPSGQRKSDIRSSLNYELPEAYSDALKKAFSALLPLWVALQKLSNLQAHEQIRPNIYSFLLSPIRLLWKGELMH